MFASLRPLPKSETLAKLKLVTDTAYTAYFVIL